MCRKPGRNTAGAAVADDERLAGAAGRWVTCGGMCGRYATTRTSTDLSALFESYDDTGGRLGADYNVAPTDRVPIVRIAVPPGDAHSSDVAPDAGAAAGEGSGADDPQRMRSLCLARWGLVPAWAKDLRGAARMINARAETVATTRAYAQSFARRRCLIPADGWYEWLRRDDATKQPYYMTRADGGVLAFAGIWSIWSRGDERLLTCSVITTAARGDLALVHDRMPLLLPPRRWEAWLAGGGDPAELLAPPADEALAAIEIRPVRRAVGDVRNNGPELIARLPAAPLGGPPEASGAMTLF